MYLPTPFSAGHCRGSVMRNLGFLLSSLCSSWCVQAMIQQNPAQARQILMAKPDLTKSLFFVSNSG